MVCANALSVSAAVTLFSSPKCSCYGIFLWSWPLTGPISWQLLTRFLGQLPVNWSRTVVLVGACAPCSKDTTSRTRGASKMSFFSSAYAQLSGLFFHSARHTCLKVPSALLQQSKLKSTAADWLSQAWSLTSCRWPRYASARWPLAFGWTMGQLSKAVIATDFIVTVCFFSHILFVCACVCTY